MNEPYKLRIPDSMLAEFAALVELYALRHGITLDEARNAVSSKVLESGIQSAQKVLDVARETTAALVTKHTGRGSP